MNLMAGPILHLRHNWSWPFFKIISMSRGFWRNKGGDSKMVCVLFSHFKKQSGILSMWDVSQSVHTWDNRGKKLIISSNINNYKTLHLHRTFHFKTLRESIKENFFLSFFFFCFFPLEENTILSGRGMLPLLILVLNKSLLHTACLL